MSRALLFLWYAQRRNAVLRYLRRFLRLRQIPRALLPVVAAGLVVYAMTLGTPKTTPMAASAFLAAALSAYLLLEVFRGFSDRGIAFEASEVDFLFPGPFTRSSLVLYHLLTTYTRSLISILFFFIFFGVRTPNPGLSLLGTAFALAVGEHLRVIAALVSVNLAEKTVARLAGPLRLLTLAVVLVLIFLLVPTLASKSGIGGGITRALDSSWARVAFYPAIAAGEVSVARGFGQAALPMAGLLACALGTLGVLLALQVHFLEASLVTSQKRAAIVERARKGRRGFVVSDAKRPTTPARLPSTGVFRGAGAVLWRNLVVARRSGRALVFSSIFSMIFVLPAFLGMGESPVYAVAFGALMPLFLSSAVAFDFRGEAEQMGRLKTLPIPAWTLALAEVAGSAIVTLGFQVLLLTALVVFAGLAPTYALVAFAGYVPVTIGLLAAANLAHLLAPKATFLTFLLQMGFLVANALVHVLATLGLLSIGVSGIGVFVPLFVLQVAVTGSVLWLVGKAFDRYDVSSSTR